MMAAAGAAALAGAAVAQPEAVAIPYANAPSPSSSDLEWLRSGLAAAKAGNLALVRQAESAVVNPVARKLLEWSSADTAPAGLSFEEIDRARMDLLSWPRKSTRQTWAERKLEASGLSARQIVDWYGRGNPTTPEGAMALAGAYLQLGRTGDAQSLIRRVWRDTVFDADTQRLMLVRFGGLLGVDDHVRRLDTLLYGQQGPAARELLPLVPVDVQQVAEARMALRSGARNGDAVYADVPDSHRRDPGLAVERARWLYDRDRGQEALPLIADFPRNPPADASSRFWMLRRQLVNVAVKAGDYQTAHRAVDGHGLPPGPDAADAEFLGGWLALTKLRDPADAAWHFGRLEAMGASPITISRALYWRGRAEEAMGDPIAATTFYGRGARYNTTFYGQLAGVKAGLTELVLDRDPTPSRQDRARFESSELIQAIRLAAQADQRDLYRALMLAAADTLTSAVDSVMLVELAEGHAEPELTMRVVRLAAQHGFTLPNRGYPLRMPPDTSPVEAPFVLAIIRQESGFDPGIRSGAGARGMMQLMPATARRLAARSGMRYRDSLLDDAEYNMRLGSSFLGDLVNQFDGSYLLATASYNAGPNRPAQWTATCGDPRSAAVDPVDYIECIPIGETRNYVMRVLENVQVYRARLNGGRAPLTLAADLRRGVYGEPQAYRVASGYAMTPQMKATIAELMAADPTPEPPARLIRASNDSRAVRATRTASRTHKVKAKTARRARPREQD